MNIKNISLNKIHEESNKLYEMINKDYDLTVFIAKSSYIIGADLAKINNTPLLEMKCSRKGKIVKNLISPVLRYLPESLLLRMREIELEKYHHYVNKRQLSFYKDLFEYYENSKHILLVDDSVDTGENIEICENELKKIYKNSKIETAALNVMSNTLKYPDYYLYEDTILRGPWSIDSKDNKEYIKIYNSWKDNYNKIKIF